MFCSHSVVTGTLSTLPSTTYPQLSQQQLIVPSILSSSYKEQHQEEEEQ